MPQIAACEHQHTALTSIRSLSPRSNPQTNADAVKHFNLRVAFIPSERNKEKNNQKACASAVKKIGRYDVISAVQW